MRGCVTILGAIGLARSAVDAVWSSNCSFRGSASSAVTRHTIIASSAGQLMDANTRVPSSVVMVTRAGNPMSPIETRPTPSRSWRIPHRHRMTAIHAKPNQPKMPVVPIVMLFLSESERTPRKIPLLVVTSTPLAVNHSEIAIRATTSPKGQRIVEGPSSSTRTVDLHPEAWRGARTQARAAPPPLVRHWRRQAPSRRPLRLGGLNPAPAARHPAASTGRRAQSIEGLRRAPTSESHVRATRQLR